MSKSKDTVSDTKQAAPEQPAQQTTQVHETGPELKRKISAKTIMGNVRRFVPQEDGAAVALYSVIGVAHGIKDGTGDNGPWVAFLGSFEATNYETGEVFRGGQCFIPKALEDMLVSTIREQQKGDSNASVQFAIEVGVKCSQSSAIGYEYTVKSLLKMSGSDPLEALRAKLPAPNIRAVAALAAPTT